MALKISDKDLADLDNLDNDTNEKREFVEIPCGDYEVRVDAMYCKTCQPDEKHPEEYYRAIIAFEILNGEYAGEYVYYWQNLTAIWMIKAVGTFMRSMKTNVDLSSARYVTDGEFDSEKYNALLEEVYDDVSASGYEYQLNIAPQEKNPNFKKYTIVQVFESE